MTKLVERDFWIPLKSSPDAVRTARMAADEEGYEVVRTTKVVFAPRETDPLGHVPAWTVTLELREKAG